MDALAGNIDAGEKDCASWLVVFAATGLAKVAKGWKTMLAKA